MSNERGELVKTQELAVYGRVEDSRLKGYTVRVTHPTQPLERTFCSRCGKPKGWVSVESSKLIAAAEVIVFCNSCEEVMNSNGGILFKRAAPDDATEIPSLQETIKQELRRGRIG